MRLKLASKITIAAVITIFILGGLATVTVFYYVQKNILDVERESLQVIAKNSTFEIDRVFIDTDILVKTITNQSEIKEYFNNPIVQEGNILKLLNRYNIGGRFSALYLLSRSGETLVSTDPSFVGNNYSFRKYFQKALAGDSSIDMAIGVTSHQPGYYVSAPVRDTNNNIAGVMVIKLKPEIIHSLVKLSGLSNSGHVMFVDDYGVIIYSDVSSRVYKSLGGLNYFERIELEKKRKYPGIQISALDYESVLSDIREKKPKGILDVRDEMDGNNEILAYHQVGDYPLYLIYEEENKSFALSAFRLSFILSLFVFVSAILATIIITLAARRFLKPMERIVLFLRKISSGKFKEKIVIKTGDEIEELSEVFNEMVDDIKKIQESVEKKVKQRTKELEKFNDLMIGRELKMIDLKEENNRLRKGIEKVNTKGWSDRFNIGLNYEEEIIRELESVYIYKIKNSKLSKVKKAKIIKLLNKLVTDSKRHNEIFKKLAKKHEK